MCSLNGYPACFRPVRSVTLKLRLKTIPLLRIAVKAEEMEEVHDMEKLEPTVTPLTICTEFLSRIRIAKRKKEWKEKSDDDTKVETLAMVAASLSTLSALVAKQGQSLESIKKMQRNGGGGGGGGGRGGGGNPNAPNWLKNQEQPSDLNTSHNWKGKLYRYCTKCPRSMRDREGTKGRWVNNHSDATHDPNKLGKGKKRNKENSGGNYTVNNNKKQKKANLAIEAASVMKSCADVQAAIARLS